MIYGMAPGIEGFRRNVCAKARKGGVEGVL